MVNGSNFIWNYLDGNTHIKRCMARGIVNNMSLAKFILKENPHLGLSVTGIITSIKRYTEESKFEEKHAAINKIFENTKLSTSSGNVVLHVNKTEHSLSALTELFKKLNLLGEDNVNIVLDKSSFALIFDDDIYTLMKKVQKKYKLSWVKARNAVNRSIHEMYGLK